MSRNHSSGFHTLSDAAIMPRTNEASSNGQERVLTQTTTRTRNVSYRFSQHFHPFAGELVKRLLKQSVAGLQAADTDYVKKEDTTRAALPGSTLVALCAEVASAEGPAGEPSTLPAGARLFLPDGTLVTLEQAASTIALTLPGAILWKAGGGMRLFDTNRVAVDVAVGQELTLPKSTSGTGVFRPDGTALTLINTDGIRIKLLGAQARPQLYDDSYFGNIYKPTDLVKAPHPVKELDFSSSGAYAAYNWELFYHAPLTIAINLSKNQRFEEAQRWLHHIFDPTDDSGGPTPARFWKVRPFQYAEVKRVEEVLINLSTGTDKTLQEETLNCIDDWKDNPFRPHVVARRRQSAFMVKTVMAYLDNLIAWGDSLFRQYTGETINEATQIYVLAANILGPRPQVVPRKGSVLPQTYATLKERGLNEFGNALVDLETSIAFDTLPMPTQATSSEQFAAIQSIGQTLYFCTPRNDVLLEYWAKVEDRLLKIHNSLNLQGAFQQVPLFEPPIDPALLARAAAAGLDISAITSGLNQPLPLVRFQFLVQKAAEICQEVKSLGNSLLSAMEKEDNEALAILRAKHERVVMDMVEHVKYGQWQEAIKSREGLLMSLALAIRRYEFYEQQLGEKAEAISAKIPPLDPMDAESLQHMKFASTEPELGVRGLRVDIAKELDSAKGKIISTYEEEELDALSRAQDFLSLAAIADSVGSAVSSIPETTINFHYWGMGGTIQFGGHNLSSAQNAISSAARGWAGHKTYQASNSSKIGSYARREQEWIFQSNQAASEITQIFKQLRASQIREAIAERELKNHRQQIKHSEEIEFYLSGEKNPDWTQKIESREKKATNRALYAWMKREVKGLYAQCFQFAFDIAKKAERALQHELGNHGLNYVQYGHLAGKEGLLAGEKLYLDVKRMEMAYHDLNVREYELTRHVSLLQLDPMALIRLQATGRCTVQVPEALFDMDCPGHYFRRIKTVAVSIPCVVGPYASINCTLSLLKSRIRNTASLDGLDYADAGPDDPRFDDYYGSLQSIVTSSSQNDSGMFETNMRDERYLPFENSGVISNWQVELPANPSEHDPAQFDYSSISDVILHLRYTAREGGVPLRNKAIAHLRELFKSAEGIGCVRLFSVRHEFPSEWAQFQDRTEDATHHPDLILNLRAEHYPFWSQRRLNGVQRVDVLACGGSDSLKVVELFDSDGAKVGTMNNNAGPGNLLTGHLETVDLLKLPIAELKICFSTNKLSDIWIAVRWKD